MDNLKSSKLLHLGRNLLQNWITWKQDFILFITATEYDEKLDNVKRSLLLHCICERVREVLILLTFLPQLTR